MPEEKLSLDVAIGVTIPARDARGRATRIGPVLDEILANHNYPPVVERLLARGADAYGVARNAAQGPAGPDDAAGADREWRDRPARLRLSRRRAPRLRPSRSRAACRRGARSVALRLVRQGLSRDHFRSAGQRRALPGHRAAGGRQPGARRPELFRPVRADPEPRSAGGRRSATAGGSPAESSSSICRKARRDASESTPSSTIPTGRTSRYSPAR